MNEIPNAYNPKPTEEKWYSYWEQEGLFKADIDSAKRPYTIVIPPPNITGILHMGHALNNTIQDILIRYRRMQGYEALWLPGTDHAGIATQNVVEKELSREGLKRQDLGRERFLERVWKWRGQYGNTIIKQLKRLGSSCDWSRTRFTMDKGLSSAVLEVFVRLYNKGLIYRGDYIINWCPRCRTALSDEEAEHRDIDGMLYYIKYGVKSENKKRRPKTGRSPRGSLNGPEANGAPHEGAFVIVATTRPETMLGDTAVAFNPGDRRYSHLKGSKIVLPILNRELDVIYDRLVDPKYGTGALKVTPAHDPVDFKLGLTHKLRSINVMNDDATMNAAAGAGYQGMDRFECREALLENLKERGLLVRTEPHRHAVGHCYRCHTMVEPRLSKQWFVRMEPLAKKALEAVKKKRIKFYPARWTKVYLNWMENIRDWCISRQIWWGHRIPVYYCKECAGPAQRPESRGQRAKAAGQKDKGVIVAKERPGRCPDCGSADIVQDPDVLDTWFSSWLWPFSTLGWPDKTDDLRYFYPTDTLVTAQEIIFFWVARMIMAGLEFAGDIPFKDVYIHGTVRDAAGTKMSKSLGNIIDPLDIIEEFGADALRFSIISITAAGQDVFLSRDRFEGGRNFANKLWNASRLVLMNMRRDNIGTDLYAFFEESELELKERWILSRFYQRLKKTGELLDAYRIGEAAKGIYDFFWHEFCDWYLELAKATFDDDKTQIVLYRVLEKSLRILHPFMPFITEEIWHLLHAGRISGADHCGKNREDALRKDGCIMETPWPHIQKRMIDKASENEMSQIISVITALRNIRATWNIGAKRFIDICIKPGDEKAEGILLENKSYIKRLAGVEAVRIERGLKKPKASAVGISGTTEIYVPLRGIINYEKEKARLETRLEELKKKVKGLSLKLRNEKFLQNAPGEIIEKFKASRDGFNAQIVRLRANLKSLGNR